MDYTATNLKADQFTFPVLELFSADTDSIVDEVGDKVDQAPEFFRNAPIIIDLKQLPDGEHIEFAVLVGLLRSFGLNPVAIRGGSSAHAESAGTMELAVLPDDRRPPRVKPKVRRDSPCVVNRDSGPETRAAGITHFKPVRSGQKVACLDGDLVIVAPASAGSELIAAGNIHVYGALRGRALAGVGGDENCRIFCQRLDAELVSVAGHYRVSEDIDDRYRGKPVQIYLANEHLEIELLET